MSGLTRGPHEWWVETSNACGATSGSETRSFTVEHVPGSPGGGLRLEKLSNDVRLSWSPCPYAAHYRVLRCDASAGPCVPSDLVGMPAGTTHLEPLDAVPYHYAVEAVNDCGFAAHLVEQNRPWASPIAARIAARSWPWPRAGTSMPWAPRACVASG